MDWSRTVRFESVLSGTEQQEKIGAASSRGARLIFGAREPRFNRIYGLLEGPSSAQTSFGPDVFDATWFDEAVIALAIEPSVPDALPLLVKALGGTGAPAGVVSCELIGEAVIVELLPSRTMPQTVLQVADVELRRLRSARRTVSLAPLPLEVTAKIAAFGLQAEEITPERVLEALLERSYVE